MSAYAQLDLYLSTSCDYLQPIWLFAGTSGASFVGLTVTAAEMTLRQTPLDAAPLVLASVAGGQLALGVAAPGPVGAQCASLASLQALEGPPVVVSTPPAPVTETLATIGDLEAVLTGTTVSCTLTISAAYAPYPAGSLVANVVGQPGQTFANAYAVTSTDISGGVASGMVFQSTNATSQTPVAAATLSVIASPVVGWTAITNPAAQSQVALDAGAIAFVQAGIGGYYAWSPNDPNTPNGSTIVAAPGGLGNWLYAVTVQPNIPAALLEPLLGIVQGSWDLLVTWSNGTQSKIFEGVWYCDQSSRSTPRRPGPPPPPPPPPASSFVYRPGGTAGGNVYTTDVTLLAALAALPGAKTVWVDDSITSPAVLNQAGMNLDGVEFTGVANYNTATGGAALEFGTAATALWGTLSFRGALAVTFAGTTVPLFSIATAIEANLFLSEGVEITCPGGQPFVNVDSASGFLFVYATASVIGDGTNTVFSASAASIGAWRCLRLLRFRT